jgi:hypothetical protein
MNHVVGHWRPRHATTPKGESNFQRMSHHCRARGCKAQLTGNTEVFMCRRHWRLLPDEMREQFDRAWCFGERTLDLQREAITLLANHLR